MRGGQKPSCSFSRSRASTLRLLSLPSAGGGMRMLRHSHFALSLSLTPLHCFAFPLSSPNLAISLPLSLTPCLSLSLLLASLALSSFPPAGSLPPSLLQLSHFSDSACFVNSKSRLLPTKTHTQTHPHTHTNWLLQTMFYSLSLSLCLFPSFLFLPLTVKLQAMQSSF